MSKGFKGSRVYKGLGPSLGLGFGFRVRSRVRV